MACQWTHVSLTVLAQTPVEQSIEQSFCGFLCVPAMIAIQVNMPQSGYWPGQTAYVQARFDNRTRRTITPRVTLFQRQTYQANGKVRVKNLALSSSSSSTGSSSVGAHRSCQWNREAVSIPSGVTPSIVHCQAIQVEYFIRVSVDVRWTCTECYLDMPIVVTISPETRLLPASGQVVAPSWSNTFSRGEHDDRNTRKLGVISRGHVFIPFHFSATYLLGIFVGSTIKLPFLSVQNEMCS